MSQIAHLQRRRHPDYMAAGYFRLRHRSRSGESRTARIRLEPAVFQLECYHAGNHGAAAEGIRRRLLRHERKTLRAARAAIHAADATRGHGRAHTRYRHIQRKARRQFQHRSGERRGVSENQSRHGIGRAADYRGDGPNPHGAATRHRRNHPVPRTAPIPRNNDRDVLPEHRLSKGEESAHLVDARCECLAVASRQDIGFSVYAQSHHFGKIFLVSALLCCYIIARKSR